MNLEKENNQRTQQLDQGLLIFLPGGTQPIVVHRILKIGRFSDGKVPDRHIIPYVLLIAGLDGIVTFVIPSPGQDRGGFLTHVITIPAFPSPS